MTYASRLFCHREMDKVELRGCLKTCQASQATHHQMDHGDPDHGGTRLGDIRIILRSAAVPTTPGEGPLHDPACWQQEDALDPVGALDHLQADFAPGPSLPDPGDERPRLRLIGPDHAQARTAVPQGVQQGHGPVAVWHAGGRDHDREEQPESVDEEVPCAAVDMCGRVVAVAPPGQSHQPRLFRMVYDGGRRAFNDLLYSLHGM